MRQHYWTDSMDGPDQISYHPPTSTQEMHHACTDCRRSSRGRTGFATCRRIDCARNADLPRYDIASALTNSHDIWIRHWKIPNIMPALPPRRPTCWPGREFLHATANP